MRMEDIFWEKQINDYMSIDAVQKLKYKTWQPCRFVGNFSAINIIRDKFKSPLSSCIELGAGSAAFSISLYEILNIKKIVAVDYSCMAKKYASLICNDMKIQIEYICADFFDKLILFPKSDIVVSLGVIEHYKKRKRMEFLDTCYNLSNSYVLIAIPNQESPLFRAYIEDMKKSGIAYTEKHEKYTLDMLVKESEECGFKIIHKDGFHCFLSNNSFLNDYRSSLLSFIDLNKEILFSIDEKGFEKYPDINFLYSDINSLVIAENNIPMNIRKKYGFMNYVLLEK